MSLEEFVAVNSTYGYANKKTESRKRELTMESDTFNDSQEINEERGKSILDETNDTKKSRQVDDNRPLSMSSGLHLLFKSNSELAKTSTTLVSKPASNLWLKIGLITFLILIAALIVGLGIFYGVTRNFKTYREACSAAQPCALNTNLICNNSCTCESASYWDSFKCTPLLSFGSTCYGGSFQCIASLSCVNNICQCDSTSYYDGVKCKAKLPYSSQCSICSYSSVCKNCISCQQCQDYANLACNSTTLTCMCPFNTSYFDASTQICSSKLGINVYCYRDLECQDLSKGLYCQTLSNMGTACLNVGARPGANFCNCPSTTYYNGAICKPLETYYASCTQSCNCQPRGFVYLFIHLSR
jgi:hypothetical protein